MNISTSMTKTFTPRSSGENEIYYPDFIKDYLPEGITHFLTSVHNASTLLAYFADCEDITVFGNAKFYYEKGNVKKAISPNIMVCFGLENVPTRIYKLWEQKIVPSVVIEIAYDETWKTDLSKKLPLYERLGVSEYYLFDAEYAFLSESSIAFRLENGEMVEADVKNNRIFNDALQLELVDTGKALGFFNPKTNEFLMTAEETRAEINVFKTNLTAFKMKTSV